MCGICGIRRFGADPITRQQIQVMLCMLEQRGLNATGLALQKTSGEIFVCKDNEPAWKFVSSDKFSDFLDEHLDGDVITFLGHTRAATKGSSRKNENNHPVFAGETAVVHNGMISNDDGLFNSLKLDRHAEVDTDIIRALLDHQGLTKDGIKALQKLSGSAAIAAVSSKYPGKLILGRSGSPLVLASTANQLMWASTKDAIHAASRPTIERFGLYFQPQRQDLAFVTMNNESVYLLGDLKDDGKGGRTALEWHDEFKSANYYNAPRYDVYNNYKNRLQKNENEDELPDAIQCPNKKCGVWITLKPNQRSMALNTLICCNCNTNLGEKEPEDEK